jgi:hypothetical protein
MRKIGLLFIIGLGMIFLTGCPYYGYRYDEGHFPDEPVNFSAINSLYDDYNMSAPFVEYRQMLIFSSNRNSAGQDFDLVTDQLYIEWGKDDGTLVIDNRSSGMEIYYFSDSLIVRCNTAANQLGPYAINYISTPYYDTTLHFLIYADDGTGDLDLKWVWEKSYYGSDGHHHISSVSGPFNLDLMNSPAQDAYLSFFGYNFNFSYNLTTYPGQMEEVYICSDRNGNFDIYQGDIPSGTDLFNFLMTGDTVPLIADANLNSGSDDKCPYINGELLVFASDRPGGYGGFDLYYCKRNGDHWSLPQNFGNKINTPYNEYRPITIMVYEFDTDLMLFSSDRPGGKGGYDIYYAGIPRMIETVYHE